MASDLEQLNPEQRSAVEHHGGPLLVLAGAGTGKTRVIVHRVAALLRRGVPPARILAVTFTNKAADEMRQRIDGLVPGKGGRAWVHTFHAFAARVLRRHARELNLTPHFTVYDADDQKRVVVEALKDLGLAGEKNKVGLYVAVISRAKDDLLDARSYSIYAMAQRDAFRQTVAQVYELYQRKLDALGGLDFGDLLLKTTELFAGDAGVRAYYQELFEHVLVDEYQDTNHAQYIITKTLAARHRNLCVVGDPDQSIYAWRGAHIRNILEFESDFADAKVVKLEQNYRSTPNILNAAGAVIRNNRQRHAKTLWTKAAEGDPVQAEELPDERGEARWVAGRVIGLVDEGASLSEIAVFYRTNAQSRSFEEAMTLAQVSYRVVGSMRFYERKEIKDILAYARAALNEADSISLTRVLNVPSRGIGKAAEEALKRYARDEDVSLREALARGESVPKLSAVARRGARELHHLLDGLSEDIRSLPPGEAMGAVMRRSGYWDWVENAVESDPDAANRLGNLQELLNAVQESQERGVPEEPPAGGGDEGARLERFLEQVALKSGVDSYEAGAPAVTLMTAHLAKGLEFPIVFVTGLEEGLFPIAAGNASRDELEEERRLCYVAMTRAKERLFLTHTATRRLFGRVYSNLPSRFILEARLFGSREEELPALEAPAPSAPVPLMRARKGMRVRHPEFGPGRIVELSGSGETMKVAVLFDNGQTRKLLVRYAPLAAA
ncbi:MAG: UvrD-helicase domain-containing protein [Elusimicrobiota bacterium]